jgi:hypothetical protein
MRSVALLVILGVCGGVHADSRWKAPSWATKATGPRSSPNQGHPNGTLLTGRLGTSVHGRLFRVTGFDDPKKSYLLQPLPCKGFNGDTKKVAVDRYEVGAKYIIANVAKCAKCKGTGSEVSYHTETSLGGLIQDNGSAGGNLQAGLRGSRVEREVADSSRCGACYGSGLILR